MLLFKNYVGKSNIAGAGLFTAEDIKKGTKTWIYQEGFDRCFSVAELDNFPGPAREFLIKYAYLYKYEDGSMEYIIEQDNGRFINHNDKDPNIGCLDEYCIALRNIKKGEELTCNYSEFWHEFKLLA